MRIKNLVFEGGGVKIIAYYGALKVLDNHNYLSEVEKFLGSSGGAIVATLLAVGYTIPELGVLIGAVDENHGTINIDRSLITQKIPIAETNRCCNGIRSLFGVLCNYGMHKTNRFEEWLGKLIEKKMGTPDLTFEELYNKFNKTLVITGSCINQSRLHFYHYRSNPTMKIKLAVRISITLPFVMEPVKWKNDYLVDGGLLCNYPLSYFDIDYLPDSKQLDPAEHLRINYETLGLKLIADDELINDNIVFDGNRLITNVGDYALGIINTLQAHIENLYISQQRWNEESYTNDLHGLSRVNHYWDRTIAIKTGHISVMDVDLKENDKKFLIEEGKKGANNWLANQISNTTYNQGYVRLM